MVITAKYLWIMEKRDVPSLVTSSDGREGEREGERGRAGDVRCEGKRSKETESERWEEESGGKRRCQA